MQRQKEERGNIQKCSKQQPANTQNHGNPLPNRRD